jgi:hypothetical protein
MSQICSAVMGHLAVLPCRQTRTCGREQVVVRQIIGKCVHLTNQQNRCRLGTRLGIVAVVAAAAVVVVVVAQEVAVVVVVVDGPVGGVMAGDAATPVDVDAAAADAGASC